MYQPVMKTSRHVAVYAPIKLPVGTPLRASPRHRILGWIRYCNGLVLERFPVGIGLRAVLVPIRAVANTSVRGRVGDHRWGMHGAGAQDQRGAGR